MKNAFLAALGPERASAFKNVELDALLAAVQASWPRATLGSEFMRHLARHAGAEPANLVTVRAADLYLAFACARNEKWALAVFKQDLLPKAMTAARSVDRQGKFTDEVRSELYERLLVAAGKVDPKIAEYSGTGPLENWVRSVAIRTAMNLLPRHAPHDSIEAASELAGADSELDFLKQKYRRDFKLAFEAALNRLPDEELNLLRLHVIEKVSIDKLCAVYQVHRATAARRITRAREVLCETTRTELAARLGLRGPELESVMRLVRSNVDLSIARVFGPRS